MVALTPAIFLMSTMDILTTKDPILDFVPPILSTPHFPHPTPPGHAPHFHHSPSSGSDSSWFPATPLPASWPKLVGHICAHTPHPIPTTPPSHEVAQLIKHHKIEWNPKESKESAEETERPWSAGSSCHSLRQERGVLKGSPGSAHGHCSPHPAPSPLRHSDNDQELSSVTAAFPAPCLLPPARLWGFGQGP